MSVVVFSDTSSAIWEVLARYNDAQLSRVTQYYAPKLQRVMIELAEEITASLTGKALFKEELK
ncbi:hypothetical protein chiPu_0027840, partial [Chiloscyllium punctatum]|nr:hypothetical protein [Chiloscyllium punctatum]